MDPLGQKNEMGPDFALLIYTSYAIIVSNMNTQWGIRFTNKTDRRYIQYIRFFPKCADIK